MAGVATLDIPVAAPLVTQLMALWTDAFGEWDQDSERVLAGSERGQNFSMVFVGSADDPVAAANQVAVAAAAQTTQSLRAPTLGTLGSVATWPQYQRRGIGTAVVAAARDRFFADGGEALFLGTGNPAAERLYQRLGWDRPHGAMMVTLRAADIGPDEFIADYYEGTRSIVTIARGDAGARACLPPLAAAPHPWSLRDANVLLQSVHHAPVRACESLLVRYERLAADGDGAWFEGRDSADRLVGVATARLLATGECRIDGFAHVAVRDGILDLLGAAKEWANERGDAIVADVAAADVGKLALFERMGIARPQPIDPIDTEGAALAAVRLAAAR